VKGPPLEWLQENQLASFSLEGTEISITFWGTNFNTLNEEINSRWAVRMLQAFPGI
jgi:hypothetical protein